MHRAESGAEKSQIGISGVYWKDICEHERFGAVSPTLRWIIVEEKSTGYRRSKLLQKCTVVPMFANAPGGHNAGRICDNGSK